MAFYPMVSLLSMDQFISFLKAPQSDKRESQTKLHSRTMNFENASAGYSDTSNLSRLHILPYILPPHIPASLHIVQLKQNERLLNMNWNLDVSRFNDEHGLWL